MAALPVISAVAGIAGAGVSAFGAYEGGQAQSQASMYQAQVAANNAAIARQNAEMETQSGEIAANNYAMRTRAVVGSTKANQAASGVDVDTGSNVNVRAAESELGALDALTIRSNAARQAYGYEVAATSDMAESQLLESESKQAKTAGTLSALGSFLGGVGSVGGKYAAWQNVGGVNPAVSTVGGPLSLNPADYA